MVYINVKGIQLELWKTHNQPYSLSTDGHIDKVKSWNWENWVDTIHPLPGQINKMRAVHLSPPFNFVEVGILI